MPYTFFLPSYTLIIQEEIELSMNFCPTFPFSLQKSQQELKKS